MDEPRKDSLRAMRAAKIIVDNRDLGADLGKIMVTLEHAVATVLLAVMGNDPKKAAGMLNEGLVAGVEKRLGLYQSRQR